MHFETISSVKSTEKNGERLFEVCMWKTGKNRQENGVPVSNGQVIKT